MVQTVVQRLDRALFGNGQPGVIEELKRKTSAHDKLIWAAGGAIFLMQFLSGSGVVSLHTLIGK